MKYFHTFLFTFLFVSTASFAQVFGVAESGNMYGESDLIHINEKTNIPDYIRFKSSENVSLEKAMEIAKGISRNNNTNFELKTVENGDESEKIYRYFQTISDYPVEFSTWLVRTKNDKVISMNGDISTKIVENSTFILTEEQALSQALKYVNAEKYMWEDADEEELLKEFTDDKDATYFPKAVKVIVPDKIDFYKSELKTTYKFEIYAQKPLSKKAVYVDAHTGEIILDLPLIHFANEIGTAYTQYSGTRSINTTSTTSSTYILLDNTRGSGIRTYNCKNGTSYPNAVDFTTTNNIWNITNTALDQYAPDAHFATMKAYDYYKNIHNRNSIDNKGFKLYSYIHFNLVATGDYPNNINAFWDGVRMTYGDGGNGITPLTTIDICGHEITHGLTSFTANLVYQNESGALNEAFSDIFGTAIEFYAKPPLAGNWTIGEDCKATMRSLSNPKLYQNPNTYKGQYWATGTADNGGVHTNGAPLCYAFYLMSQGGSGTNDKGNSYSVAPITMAKAEQIMYRTLTKYLTSSSNYNNVYFYAKTAATDLYGECSPEVEAVLNAFYAIGVVDNLSTLGTDFSANSTDTCSPPFTVAFKSENATGSQFLWDFGDGTPTSTAQNPTHTYNSYGMFNVKLTTNACKDNVKLKENFITISSDSLCNIVMPVNTKKTIELCEGYVFDAGGRNGTYPDNNKSILTIHAPGANHIIIDVLEIDIEEGSGTACNYDFLAFYNGKDTIATLINSLKYCNTTGLPNAPIISSGEYITIYHYSDPYVNGQGFKLKFACVSENTAPVALFSADQVNSCDGLIHFTDESHGNPTAWAWDFGDGTTSHQQNPEHQYLKNGTYNVKLTVSNEHGEGSLLKSNDIKINMPPAPVVENVSGCSDSEFDIDLQLDGNINWYDADLQLVHNGSSWTHPPLENNTTYYLRNSYNQMNFTLGDTRISSGGRIFNNSTMTHYLVFDAYRAFTLKKVTVNAGASGNRVIALRNSSGQVIQQKTINIQSGVSTITLDFNVPVGTNLQLACVGSNNLYRNNTGSTYPYKINDVVSIKYSSATDDEYVYYYYFYNWQIEATMSCLSEAAELQIITEKCIMTPSPVANFSADTTKSCDGIIHFTDQSLNSPTSWEWDFGDGSAKSNEQNPTHHYLKSGTYTVKLTVSNQYDTDSLKKTGYIQVEIPPIFALDAIKGCSDMEFYIDLNLNGAVYWYNAEMQKVHTGNKWKHQPVETNTTYYIATSSEVLSCQSEIAELHIIPEKCINSLPDYVLNEVFISPNPSNGLFYVNGLEDQENYDISVTDVSGKTILEKQTLKDNILDLSPFSEGLYLVKIADNKGYKIFKVIKK